MNKITLLFITSIVFSCVYSQKHVLPELNFNFKSLEPTIDSITMRIHFTKHHQSYVTNLNKALESENLNNQTLEEILHTVSKKSESIRNNAGGHFNHTLFWSTLSPTPSNQIDPKFNLAIQYSFGSLDSLKKTMTLKGSKLFGSGWVWLILKKDNTLSVTTTPNQDNPLMDIAQEQGIPLLGIDVWEHAYYLKYQNKRMDYLNSIWTIIDWATVSNNYLKHLKK